MLRLLGLSAANRLLAKKHIPLPLDHPEGRVDWVSGAAVMFRFAAIRDIGFFDPAYFLYYEETDLMRRLAAAGWHTLTVPSARVIHDAGATTKVDTSTRQRQPTYLYQSRRRYLAGHHGTPAAVLAA